MCPGPKQAWRRGVTTNAYPSLHFDNLPQQRGEHRCQREYRDYHPTPSSPPVDDCWTQTSPIMGRVWGSIRLYAEWTLVAPVHDALHLVQASHDSHCTWRTPAWTRDEGGEEDRHKIGQTRSLSVDLGKGRIAALFWGKCVE